MRTILLLLLMLPGLVLAAAEPGEEGITRALKLGVSPPVLAPERGPESAGPYDRLLIRNAYLFDGSAPMQGPTSIEVRGDRITAIGSALKPDADTEVIDAEGLYVIPGLIDSHVHLGTPNHAYAGKLTDPDYVMKLYLAHGVTTLRDVGSVMGLGWTVEHKRRAERGEITSPRIFAYAMFPTQHADVDAARRWVKAVKRRGADGVKFRGGAPELVAAAIDEARKLNMKTAMHHDQTSVTRMHVLDSARLGLDSMEHWYGLPEAMFVDRRVQDYPLDYNYSDEQHRFGEAGRLWVQAAAPGSAVWYETIDELIALDFTLDPTLTIYEASRDVERARLAEWHDDYTMPYIMRAFEPDPEVHGSYFFDWTTAHEVAWRQNYQRWMQFLNDYKNSGGRVTAGSDAGYIYKLYGFSFIRELELLQEAGFHPLEVLTAATLSGAELLGVDDEIGTIQVGKKADLVLVADNPVANFKVLYGTGHRRLDRSTNTMQRAEGIRYTIKDGIVFDAKQMLAQVRDMVAAEKAAEKGAEAGN